jgi:hypothetical protein
MLPTATQLHSVLIWYAFCYCRIVTCISAQFINTALKSIQCGPVNNL